MSITFNLTPPITEEDIDAAVGLLESLRGVCPGGCAPAPVAYEIEGTDSGAVTAPVTETDNGATADSLAKSTDGAMIPWDERIHSKGKSVNADRSWRLKRGVPEETVKAVEAELAQPTETTPAPAGIQTESQSEATPPPGAVEAMN